MEPPQESSGIAGLQAKQEKEDSSSGLHEEESGNDTNVADIEETISIISDIDVDQIYQVLGKDILKADILGDADLYLECEDDDMYEVPPVNKQKDDLTPQGDESPQPDVTFKLSFPQGEDLRPVRYQCDLCSKTFTRPTLVLDHKATSHGAVNLFPCPECKYRGNMYRHLMKHVRRMHPMYPETGSKNKENLSDNSGENDLRVCASSDTTKPQMTNFGVFREQEDQESQSSLSPHNQGQHEATEHQHEESQTFSHQNAQPDVLLPIGKCEIPNTEADVITAECSKTSPTSRDSSTLGYCFAMNSSTEPHPQQDTFVAADQIVKIENFNVEENDLYQTQDVGVVKPMKDKKKKSKLQSKQTQQKVKKRILTVKLSSKFGKKPSAKKQTLGKKSSVKKSVTTSKALKRKADPNAPRIHICTSDGCAKAFSTKEKLQCHLTIHTRKFKCTWEGCSATFRNRYALEMHTLCHTGEKPHKCLHCEYRCRQKVSLDTHMMWSHMDILKEEFKNRMNEQADHAETTSGEKQGLPKKKIKGEKRKKGILNKTKGDEKKRGIPNKTNEGDKKKQRILNKTKEEQEKLMMSGFEKDENGHYKCNQPGCNSVLRHIDSIKEHVAARHGPKIYKCSIENCTMTFSVQRYMEAHQRNHAARVEKLGPGLATPVRDAKGMYLCGYPGCQAKLVRRHAWREHKMAVHGEKTKVCGIEGCTKSYATKTQLLKHQRLHGQVFRCTWEGCNKTFSNASNLKVHRMIHTGEKQLQCELCGYTCIQRNSMNWHMKSKHSEGNSDNPPKPRNKSKGKAGTKTTTARTVNDSCNVEASCSEKQAAAACESLQMSQGQPQPIDFSSLCTPESYAMLWQSSVSEQQLANPYLQQVHTGMTGFGQGFEIPSLCPVGGNSSFGYPPIVPNPSQGAVHQLPNPSAETSNTSFCQSFASTYGQTPLNTTMAWPSLANVPTNATVQNNNIEAMSTSESRTNPPETSSPVDEDGDVCSSGPSAGTSNFTKGPTTSSLTTSDTSTAPITTSITIASSSSEDVERRWDGAIVVAGEQILKLRFPCQYPGCSKVFSSERGRKYHEDEKHGPKKYKCVYDDCDRMFGSVKSRNKHLNNTHSSASRKCTWEGCSKVLSNASNLRLHLRTHTREVRFSCSHCPYKCIQKSAMQYHMVKKHPAEAFKFDTISSLASTTPEPTPTSAEVMTFENAKVAYQCDYPNCGKVLSTKRGMKEHKDVVHGQRTFKCTIDGCNKAYTNQRYLECHMRQHMGSYPCEWEGCTRLFRDSHNLAMHYKTHTGLKDLKCRYCSYACIQKNSLNWHMKTKHPQELEREKLEKEAGLIIIKGKQPSAAIDGQEGPPQTRPVH